jgi:hypothetical protein
MQLCESADCKLGEFKHKLKMETELCKDNATKAADSAVHTTSHVHPCISTSSPHVTHSQSRKSNVSQSRDISIEHPQSITPKASLAVATPLSQALMEPLSQSMIGHGQALIEPSALFQPLTDTLVGPPLNFFKEAMMAVDTNILLTVADSIHNPS